MKVPIVREGYLVDCFIRQKMLPVDQYKVESVAEPAKGGTIKVKVKGQSAVHEASGLQDACHILQDKTTIYNTTLNMSDLSTGINRYFCHYDGNRFSFVDFGWVCDFILSSTMTTL